MTQYLADSTIKPLSILDLAAMKRAGEKITCLTAYDASFSTILDNAGVDAILVGDSLGMVVQGHGSTLPVSMSDMVYHTACVARRRRRSLLIADLPFMSCATVELAAENAARLIQEGGAQVVKLEGARPEIIEFLSNQGIAVCGHLGLLPQSINQLGRYRVQGREEDEADKILEQARQLEQAGAAMLVLECIPAQLARTISRELRIPVIGIGAGVDCDGQVLVLYDMLDIGIGRRPRFSKNYLQAAGGGIDAAVQLYVSEVRQSLFPDAEHGF